MSLVVVGSVAYDGLETPHGKVDRILGGSCTYISLAASFFTRVRIVAVVGDDFAEADAGFLSSRGIDLEGLERVPGKTFFWAGVYSPDMNDRTTLVTELNVFADFKPQLPESYRAEPYLLLGNIQPALQRSVRGQMNGVRYVGGDTMNYWIGDYRDELLSTIRQWDFLLITSSCPGFCWMMYSIPPARATASRADSWATWRSRASARSTASSITRCSAGRSFMGR